MPFDAFDGFPFFVAVLSPPRYVKFLRVALASRRRARSRGGSGAVQVLTRTVVVAGLVGAALPPATAVAAPAGGTFSVLSYNVAGLPEGLSSGNPRVNTPIIGQRIRPYDVVHVQEDFNYHAS